MMPRTRPFTLEEVKDRAVEGAILSHAVIAYERERCVARFSPFKSSLHLLFFLLGPRSECLRIFLPCLRDNRLTIFVALAMADRGLVPGSSRLVSGYDIGTFERSNKPAQSLKEGPQFIWIGKRYRTDIFRSFTVGNPTNDEPPILRIRSKDNCRAMATDLDFVSFRQLSYHTAPLLKKAEKLAFVPRTHKPSHGRTIHQVDGSHPAG
jgi:hypothetical protein